MKERSFQTTFNHWLKNVYKKTAVFELKQCAGSLPFSAVKPHQIAALLQVRHQTLVYKLPDMGFEMPFDCIIFTGEPAYVVIKYPKFFCLIAIDTFVLESQRSKRRSLTASRAQEIAIMTIS